jgi:clan AA aspartic protease (TIGR02281 family)
VICKGKRRILRLRPYRVWRWWKVRRSSTLAGLALLLLLGAKSGVEEIRLEREGDVYSLPVRINDVITLDFILDTGAVEVQIPEDVARTLLRQKAIKADDFLPGATYTLADGSTVRSPRLTVRSLQIGNHRMTSVPASIGTLTSVPILGMSFLSRLETFSINTTRRLLISSPVKLTDKRLLEEEAKPRPSENTPQQPNPLPQSGPPSASSASIDLQSAITTAEKYVRQMTMLASTEGGIEREVDILAAKRRIEALHIKDRFDRKQRTQARQENEKGLQYLQGGQLTEAVTAFQVASQTDPAAVEIVNNLGYAYLLQGDLPAAEQSLLRTLAFAPGRTNAWANLGHTYAHRGDVRGAVACFANAYRFSRNQETTRQFLQKWGEEANDHVREAARRTLQLQLISR